MATDTVNVPKSFQLFMQIQLQSSSYRPHNWNRKQKHHTFFPKQQNTAPTDTPTQNMNNGINKGQLIISLLRLASLLLKLRSCMLSQTQKRNTTAQKCFTTSMLRAHV